MSCEECQKRAALIAALAPAISRLSLNRDELLGLLALPDAQLLAAATVEKPRRLLRGLELPVPTSSVPTALCRHDAGYPAALAQLPSAPAVLYATCTVASLRDLLAKPTAAIVGGETHTDYAEDMTVALASNLASGGITVISGLEDGLERTAHRAALEGRGPTIAVMPCGPEIPTSARQAALHQRILARGAALSEFPPGFFPAQRWCFTACQRIMAALASVTIVAEAGGRPCAPLDARIAVELGNEVAVVPGRVTDAGGLGMLGLLRDGARPVACAEEILDLIAVAHPN
jgi:DNA processing protein